MLPKNFLKSSPCHISHYGEEWFKSDNLATKLFHLVTETKLIYLSKREQWHHPKVEARPLDPESFAHHAPINTTDFANLKSSISYWPKKNLFCTDLVVQGHERKANLVTMQDYYRQKMTTDPTTPENQTSARWVWVRPAEGNLVTPHASVNLFSEGCFLATDLLDGQTASRTVFVSDVYLPFRNQEKEGFEKQFLFFRVW